jgi:large subunit ribosomal protein L13
MKTRAVKASEITRQWFVMDAKGQTLGRMASEVAKILSGKTKPIYSPHLDTGDFVIIVNAEKIQVTGRKLQQKMYYRHTMYPGGLRSENLTKALKVHPERVLERAVRGMLPRGPLGDAMARKLKVYAGPSHPHEAQVKGSANAAE